MVPNHALCQLSYAPQEGLYNIHAPRSLPPHLGPKTYGDPGLWALLAWAQSPDNNQTDGLYQPSQLEE